VSTPVVTDVFKFLAVRPAQRVTEKETERTVIRDERAVSAAGARDLAELARKLGPSGAALAHWDQLERSTIDPFVEGYRELIRSYEAADPAKPAPDGKALLNKAGLDFVKDGRDPKLIKGAWEALYAAHATGNDAGLRLETPMAALRVIHFAQSLTGVPTPSPLAALEVLRATVAISPVFDDVLRARERSAAAPGPAAGPAPVVTGVISPEATQRSQQIRSLAEELNATERLLQSAIEAPALENIDTVATPTRSGTGWATRINVTTTPTLRQALVVEPSRVDTAILDRLRLTETTPAPVAAQALQLHLGKLSDSALMLADDPEFQAAMMELSGAVKIAPVSKVPAAQPLTAPDVDVSGRITPLGIGDLKVVKQTLLAYVAGEVAHIENVLKGESKERTHRKLDRTETTLITSEEETKDTERDTQSTDRFELKREAENTLKEDLGIKAGLTVTATYGPVVATATGDFAYSTSKQESEKSSSNFAREVVDRSVSKVQTKTKTERTTKTLNEVEEINKHSLNNSPPSTGHVTGIYRWVDKRYRAQVYNYGARLLLEFVIPEPASYYRAARSKGAPKVNGTAPHPFLQDIGLFGTGPRKPLIAEHIHESNYLAYAARYGAAGIVGPPPLFTYISTALAKEKIGEGTDFAITGDKFVVPAGYLLNSYSLGASFVMARYPRFVVQVRGDVWALRDTGGGGRDVDHQLRGDPASDNAKISGVGPTPIPVSIVCYDVFAFAVNIQGVCIRTDEEMSKWRLDTFGKIQTAYQALQTAYDQKVTQAEAAVGISIEGQNPASNRVIEKKELKKLCITMMTGQHYKQFGAMTEPPNDPVNPPEVDVFEALHEGPIIQFFEQAFEWEQMTFLYYPYFWGRKKNWGTAFNLSDPDPMFQEFLTAGAARVLVPVPLAYITSVQFLLQNPLHETELRKKVWGGGDRPTLDDKDGLYISIAEELRNQTDDLAGATPEGEPWEFMLPTTLVWLQPDDKLPTFV
jgi:hypothetical protein